jgi:uncharacterized membrane protein/predicted DsbA family dithiol-disulfide isomerase
MENDNQDLTTSPWELILRGLAAVGLGGSALLLREYVSEAPRFCSPGEGCDVVRQSQFAKILGIHTPVYGLLFFGGALLLALNADRRARRLLLAWAAGGALFGAGFISLQLLVVHAFCIYCAMVNVTAILLFGLVLARRSQTAPPLALRRFVGTGTVVAIGFAVPFGVGVARHPSAELSTVQEAFPQAIEREQQRGIVTVVEFADFECPFCRAQHAALKRLLDDFGTNVRIVRKHYPLPMHADAKAAARAAICAEENGRGELMADMLFASDDLSLPALEKMGKMLGLDPVVFRSCLDCEGVTRRLNEDADEARDANVQALPTFFVGRERFDGFQKDDNLVRTALAHAVEALLPAPAKAEPLQPTIQAGGQPAPRQN